MSVSRISGLLFITYLLLVSCGQSDSRSAKFTQYYNQGQQLYEQRCSNCHQRDGSGLGRLYPPLDTSDYMDKNFADVLCLMRTGIDSTLVVNGVEYNKEMPGIPSLTDLEVAEIATYIYNTWTHKRGIVEVKDASVVLSRCQDAD